MTVSSKAGLEMCRWFVFENEWGKRNHVVCDSDTAAHHTDTTTVEI